MRQSNFPTNSSCMTADYRPFGAALPIFPKSGQGDRVDLER